MPCYISHAHTYSCNKTHNFTCISALDSLLLPSNASRLTVCHAFFHAHMQFLTINQHNFMRISALSVIVTASNIATIFILQHYHIYGFNVTIQEHKHAADR